MSSLTVPSGATVTTSTNVGGTDVVDVNAGGTISVNTANPDIDWNTNATGAGVVITNDGTIAQTGTGASARAAIGSLGAAPVGTLTLLNTGTISSTSGPGINFSSVPAGGTEIITDSGTISGGSGLAIQFGAGNDTLNLVSGYSIIGRVDGGGGSNTLNLSGAGGGSIRGQSEYNGAGGSLSFAGFDNINVVNVQSGAWSLYGGGYYDALNIFAGATFIVDQVNAAANGNPSDGGLGPLNGSLSITNNGVLELLNPSTVQIYYDPSISAGSGGLTYAGSGVLALVGFYAIAPNQVFNLTGPAVVTGGTTLVLGALTANVTVNSGATLQIGGGGGTYLNQFNSSNYVDPGTTGAVIGDIVDNGVLKIARLDNYTLSGSLTGNGVLQEGGPGSLTLRDSTNFSGHVTADGGTLNLAGIIATTQTSTAAISSSGGPGYAVNLSNTGTVSSATGAAVDMSAATHSVTVTNSGSLSGDTSLAPGSRTAVILSGNDDSFTDSGAISGNVLLGAGNDTLMMKAGGSITGVIYGGAGADVFAFDGAVGSYEIADFSAAQGDRLDLSGLSGLHDITDVLARTTQVGADTVIALSGTTITLDNFQSASLGVNDVRLGDPERSDFNGDGKGDIVWQNANGSVSVWVMNDTTPSGFNLPAATGWQLQDSGDFNGDGLSADLLFRNSASGMVDIWTDNNGQMAGADVTQVTLDWNIMGTADFNGDGKSDILWRNEQNGYVSIWLMNGNKVQSTWNPGNVDLSWHIVGAADYAGIGDAQILWRNVNSGEVDLWTMNASTGQAAGAKVAMVGLEWQVAGSGDFNGDGKTDILWRDTATGQIVIWEMNGPQVLHAQAVATLGSQWKTIDVTDINGDGKADIIWRDSNTGQVVAWAMNGFNVDHQAVLANVAGAWSAANHHFDWA